MPFFTSIHDSLRYYPSSRSVLDLKGLAHHAVEARLESGSNVPSIHLRASSRMRSLSCPNRSVTRSLGNVK